MVSGKMRTTSNKKISTNMGECIQGDCIQVMKDMKDGSFDMIFADPPFNLGKEYRSGIDDKLPDEEYIRWSKEWIAECVRLLKDGGTFFIFNLPKWNIEIASFLNSSGMNFRHWIAIDMPNGLPIKGRLYPSHYSLLYFTKGRANCFNPPRLPIDKCRHCDGDIKDYGGHRGKLNPSGLNLKDVWTDIGKVSGRKNRVANELPIKLLDRCLDIGTMPGDLVLDPFMGSGTTAVVAELKGRRWVGIEKDDLEDIRKRFDNIELDEENLTKVQFEKNKLEINILKKVS